MITKACPNCHKLFSFYPSNPKRYCSRVCQSQASRAITKCPECGKEFWYHKSWVRKYCSRKCSAKYASRNLGEYAEGVGIINVICDNCGITFAKRNDQVVGKNFCTQKCFGEYLTKTRTGIPRPEVRGEKPHLQKRTDLICKQCDKVFQVKNSSAYRRRYCSKKCMSEAKSIEMRGKNSQNWKGGVRRYYGENWRAQSRATRRRDNYTCQRCGITQKEYGRQLDVHHKIPFREFGIERYLEANDLSNLISYCNRCHIAIEHEQGLRPSL